MKAILGYKKGMTRVFDGEESVAVTVVDVSDCVVSGVRDGGIEIGLGKVKATKALQGQYKDLGYSPRYKKFFASFEGEHKVGDKIETLVESDIVDVYGKSKGKGFAGVVKRWKFKGGPKTHGQSDRERAPGSIGAGTDPGRVIKGKKMAGRMGSDAVKLKDRKVVKVVEGLVLIKGPVPGSNGDLVVVIKK